jgi:hypothetical protein
VTRPLRSSNFKKTSARTHAVRSIGAECLHLTISGTLGQCCAAIIRPPSCKPGTAACDAGAALRSLYGETPPLWRLGNIVGAGLCPTVVAGSQGSLCQQGVLERHADGPA